MKITMVTCAAGPQGVARRGTVLDVQQADADVLLKGQYARQYDKERDSKSPVGFAKAPDKFD